MYAYLSMLPQIKNRKHGTIVCFFISHFLIRLIINNKVVWFIQDSRRSYDCFYSELNSTSGQGHTKSRTWQNSKGLVNIWLLLPAIKDRPLPSPIRLLIWPHLHERMFRWLHVQRHCSKAKETQVQKLRRGPLERYFCAVGHFEKKSLTRIAWVCWIRHYFLLSKHVSLFCGSCYSTLKSFCESIFILSSFATVISSKDLSLSDNLLCSPIITSLQSFLIH